MNHSSDMPLQQALEPVLRVVGELNGHFVFTDGRGRRFVIARAEALEEARAAREEKPEQQLSLPSADAVRYAIQKHVEDIDEEILERINRDIAVSAVSEEEDHPVEDEFVFAREVQEEGDELPKRPTPPPPVRFEPIKGDLAPELQGD